MFLINLNSEQKAALLNAAHRVMEADGIIHEREVEIMKLLQEEAGASIHEKSFTYDELSHLFQTRREKLSFLLELIAIAQCDGEWHIKEKELIEEYAHCLSVSQETINQLIKWIDKQLALSMEAEQLLNGEI